MSEKSKGQSLLENAYELSTPDDNKAYYAEFAATYDEDFAAGLGYQYPQAIARLYHQYARAGDTPIADVGCGTGLVAEAIRCPAEDIDGVDISQAMLEKARSKKLYRDTIQADLTADISLLKKDYGAVVSAGTFTTGHLGPKPLAALLDIARADALFVIGVNDRIYESAGFADLMQEISSKGLIRDLIRQNIKMYGREGHDHSEDTASVLVYRKV